MQSQTTKVKTNAKWKIVYDEAFRKLPKNKRRTMHQIKHIRSSAKLWVELYQ